MHISLNYFVFRCSYVAEHINPFQCMYRWVGLGFKIVNVRTGLNWVGFWVVSTSWWIGLGPDE